MSTREEELRRLAVAVAGWSNCNKAWRNPDEDGVGAVVGHIDEDGNTYPVAAVDCDLYYSDDSLSLAEFYAAANPAAVLELLDEIERLRAVFEAAHRVLKNPGCHQPMTMLHKAVQAVMFAEQGDE